MKSFRGRHLGAWLAASALLTLSCMDITPASAQVTYNGSPIVQGNQFQGPDMVGFANATRGINFATTSYLDMTSSSVTIVPAPYDPTVNVDYLWATWYINQLKNTSGTGQCGLFANGALLPETVQTISFTVNNTPVITGMSFLTPLATSGSQVVKLQCKGSDTLPFTINAAQLVIWEIQGSKPYNP